MDKERLLADLAALSEKHPNYSGKVERDPVSGFKLTYYPNKDADLIEEKRIEWNEGARAIDSISKRVIRYLKNEGVELPDAETGGASVMAWVFREQLPTNRGSANALTNAFDATREAVLLIHDDSETKLEKLTAQIKARQSIERSLALEREQSIAKRERLKTVGAELKKAAFAFAHSESKPSDLSQWADAIHLACNAIQELGLWESLQRNAKRLEADVAVGGRGSYAVELAVADLQLNLLLLSAAGKTKSKIVSIVKKSGVVSVSACGELWKDIWHAEEFESSQVDELMKQYRAMESLSFEIAKLPLGPKRDEAFQRVMDEERRLRSHPAFPKTIALSPIGKLLAEITATWVNLGRSIDEHERMAWGKWIDSPSPRSPDTSNPMLGKLGKQWADLFEGADNAPAQKTLSEKLLAIELKPNELKQAQWLKTPEGELERRKIENWIERLAERDKALGNGDGDYYRVLLEVREATGLDIEAIENMDAAEFDKLADAILRKREQSHRNEGKHPRVLSPEKRIVAIVKRLQIKLGITKATKDQKANARSYLCRARSQSPKEYAIAEKRVTAPK